jgi:hypothetical protein
MFYGLYIYFFPIFFLHIKNTAYERDINKPHQSYILLKYLQTLSYNIK